MKIKIISKKYQANVENKENTVYFEVDGKSMSVDIIYLNSPTIGKRNVFVDNNKYKELEKYITEKYNCEFKDFQNYFLHELRRYSNNRNLDPVNFKFI